MGLLQDFEGLNGLNGDTKEISPGYVCVYICVYIYANIGALHCIPCIHYIYEYLTYILYNTYII